jgi:hypothetical protein
MSTPTSPNSPLLQELWRLFLHQNPDMASQAAFIQKPRFIQWYLDWVWQSASRHGEQP